MLAAVGAGRPIRCHHTRRADAASSVTSLRAVSAAVAEAVAQAKGLAQAELDDPAEQIAQAMWVPAYPVVEAV